MELWYAMVWSLLLLLSIADLSSAGLVTPRSLLQEAESPSPDAAALAAEAASAPADLTPPLATLGPMPADSGAAIIITLDMWGVGLLTFNLVQQEILLAAMNETILDVQDDELQLLTVEDILPNSGPSAVSTLSVKDATAFSTGLLGHRRLLESTRILLQSDPLAMSGNATGVSSLPHLEVTVRASVSPNEVELLYNETETAVDGPLLPMLVAAGINVQYMELRSLTSDAGASAPAPTSSGHRVLDAGDIAAIVALACIIPAAIVGVILLVRRRRMKRQAAILAKGSISESERSSDTGHFSGEGSGIIDGLHAFVVDRSPYSRSITPPGSVISTAESRESKGKFSKAMDPSLCTVPFQELQFSRVIGEGSYGRVFLGKWQETTVAIKILLSPGGGPLPDESWDLQDVSQLRECSWSEKQASQTPAQRLMVEELRKEASLMAKLRHPNTVMFLGAALDPPCMITEFCARGSLLDVLHRARTNTTASKELDWRRRLRLALDAAKGMNYLHSRQPPVLHRDLKSANLLVDKHWQAKVADFNLSRVMHPSVAISSIAATNPRWLPPEILAGRSYNSSTDVYAFGIIMWELLTWDIPWKEETPWQVVIAVVDHDQRPEIPSHDEAPGGFPVAWDAYRALMQECWAADSELRPSFESIINSMRTLIDLEDADANGVRPLPAVVVQECQAIEKGPQGESMSPTIQLQPLPSPFLHMPALPGRSGDPDSGAYSKSSGSEQASIQAQKENEVRESVKSDKPNQELAQRDSNP